MTELTLSVTQLCEHLIITVGVIEYLLLRLKHWTRRHVS
jgi:hypothetical protein